MVTEEAIRTFADEIARRYAPEKIILFGSYANGHPTPDLMVILNHPLRNVEKAIEIDFAIRRPFPLDLFVRRPSDIAQRVAMNDWFIRDIVEKGRVLYERPHA
jgi:predicted nucleotidyltransferase